MKSLVVAQVRFPNLVTIQMKAIGPYFPVVLFTTLNRVAISFESVDEILKFDHSNKNY